MSIALNSPSEPVKIAGDMALGSQISITAPDGATIHVGGSLLHSHTNEANLALAKTSLHFDGAGTGLHPQQLEVGGVDVNVLTQLLPHDNFSYNDITVGQADQRTVFYFVDLVNNGNRAGNPNEAIYLFGEDLDDSLRVLGDSFVVIHGLNVYAKHEGELINLQSLFGPDEKYIPFDDGMLSRIPIGDVNGDGVVDTADVAAFVLALTNPQAYQDQYGLELLLIGDINGDGVFDTADVAPFVQLLVGGGSQSVPEPGSLALLGLSGLLWLRRRPVRVKP